MTPHIKHWLRLIIPASAPKKPTRYSKYSAHSTNDIDPRRVNKPPAGDLSDYGYEMFTKAKWL